MRFAVLALVLLAGCAGRAARIHLHTAQQAHAALETGADLVEAVCTTERAEAEGQGFVDACHEAATGQRAAVEAHTAWTRAAATEGLEAPDVVAHLGDLVRLYGALRAFLGLYGRDLPEVF